MTSAPVPPAVRWSEDGQAVQLLDQTLLPTEERWLRLETPDQVAEAITSLRVRGAPAIGIAGALGLAVAARELAVGSEPAAARARVEACHDLLLATRPTGQNLSWSLERVLTAFERGLRHGVARAVAAAREEADQVVRDELDMCQRIGTAGADLVPEEGATVLTHCNAGALATAGLGTALAPVYVAHGRGVPVRVVACETRPVLQGARLTAWELRRAGVPVTVVTDSMAGALMREGGVNMVITGADRVAANGDVANKIGTYGLAVLARHHAVPFYVAAPRSTFDAETSTGADIEIEQRAESEVREVRGQTVAPKDVAVWNPAFDVTPAHLITALVTDAGVLRPPYGPRIRDLTDPSLPTPEDR